MIRWSLFFLLTLLASCSQKIESDIKVTFNTNNRSKMQEWGTGEYQKLFIKHAKASGITYENIFENILTAENCALKQKVPRHIGCFIMLNSLLINNEMRMLYLPQGVDKDILPQFKLRELQPAPKGTYIVEIQEGYQHQDFIKWLYSYGKTLKSNLEIKKIKKHLIKRYVDMTTEQSLANLVLALDDYLITYGDHSGLVYQGGKIRAKKSKKKTLVFPFYGHFIPEQGFFIDHTAKVNLSNVRYGDIITMVEGKDLTKVSERQEASKILREAGSKVDLKIKRGKKLIDLEVRKQSATFANVNSERWKAGGHDILVIKVRSFYDRDIPKKFEAIMRKNPITKKTKIIFDLRDNTGGYVQMAYYLASFLISKNAMFHRSKRIQSDKMQERANLYDALYFNPIVTLQNGNTGSAAELVVSSMINDRMVNKKVNYVVGNRSFGKGLSQIFCPRKCLYDNKDHFGELLFFEEKTFTPNLNLDFLLVPTEGSKEIFHNKGILPDFLAQQEDDFKRQEDFTINPVQVAKKPYSGKVKPQLKTCVNAMSGMNKYGPYIGKALAIFDCLENKNKVLAAR